MLSYEKDLERFYLRRYEREITNIKRNFESKIEEILEEKELRNRELIHEIHELKEVLKEYRNNYISLNDHEIILNKLKSDLYKEIRNQRNKLDLIQSRRTEESQLITEFDNNRNKNLKPKKAYVKSILLRISLTLILSTLTWKVLRNLAIPIQNSKMV
jgi:hypothetical protein